MSPLPLWALALALVALGLRERRAAARPARPAGGGPGLPVPLALASRLPWPPDLVGPLARPSDAALIVRCGLADQVPPAALARARAGAALAGLVLSAAAVLVVPAAAILAPVLVAAGLAAPGRWLSRRARARRRALVRELPDLLDLLGICVEAGMSLDPALELSAGRLGGVLGDEIGVVLRDLALGTPRARAYRDLAERCDAPELARTVGALLQAEELGSPLSRALQGQAEALRELRRQDARERAARAAPKIQLVVATLMVPAVLLLVIGVLLVELARQVGGVVG